MKIDLKILRVDVLSKFFLKISLMENLKFSCWFSPTTLGIQLGNKYFWKFSKQIIYSLGKLLMVLKCSYLSQNIKWERALGKHDLHCRAHLDLDSLPPPWWVSPKNKEIWTLHMDETRYVCSGSDHLHGGVLYLVTLKVQG